MTNTDKTEDVWEVAPTIAPPGPAIPNDPKAKQTRLRDSSLRLTDEADKLSRRLKRSYEDLGTYWGEISNIQKLRCESDQCLLDSELEEHVEEGGSIEEFLGLDTTRKLKDAIGAYDRLQRLYNRQQTRLDSSSSLRRTIMGLFTTSSHGLNAKAGMGSRERKDQRAFRKNLILAYDLKDEKDKDKKYALWNVAQGNWVPEDSLIAAHIYPYSWGQKMMTEFFGEECSNELFSARNGLMFPQAVEGAMGEWALVIVPDIEDNPTPDQVQQWTNNVPHEYKFRVLDPDHAAVEKIVSFEGGTPTRVKDLDQVRLQFRGSIRPRARYLWLWFACAVLRRFWRKGPRQAAPILTPQFGKGVWATPGPYLRRDFILGLMEEIGHEQADFLLSGAKPATSAEDETPNPVLIDLVNQQIVLAARKEFDEEEEEQDDDEGIQSGREENE
ncbi:hypothetical protein F4802DRAFT_18029 [Xylaria palmicola]|nr:hypothetical protein F4802DRAFT_18029 [Xylaria palmicola]